MHNTQPQNLTTTMETLQGKHTMAQHATNQQHSGMNNEQPSPSRYQAIGLAKHAFKAFVSDPANKPTRNYYGTKFPGNVKLEHFMLWAVLRGKDPAGCTHDAKSDRYTQAIAYLAGLFMRNDQRSRDALNNVLLNVFGGHISSEQATTHWLSLQKKN